MPSESIYCRYGSWCPGSAGRPNKVLYTILIVSASTGETFEVEAKSACIDKTIDSLMSSGFVDSHGTTYRVDKVCRLRSKEI